ncbi:DoxX family membrane protein [Promicromonospora citrea]|uniref:Membrane protein n=1 Tax=Promicromonospora citrea TaxID=43677 RepID=A0A8H9GPR6_9MICO|nr:DoxX family membrane protein [Promicromonospora citrea]NNH54041.1 DoxX family membrane protein [Promicromonospora citrea]GGM44690.1 membrane protein [Promicromonospora citrea]
MSSVSHHSEPLAHGPAAGARATGTTTTATDAVTRSAVARYSFAGVRLLLAVEFLWAFGDKLFGWNLATPPERAWINGGSPTEGYLSGVEGPFGGFFGSLAGSAVIDWLFMLGLLGIGLALALGIGMRLAAATGALLMLLMWLASLPLDNNPFVDYHLVDAVLLVGLAAILAGDTLGLGRWWAGLPMVQRFPFLR